MRQILIPIATTLAMLLVGASNLASATDFPVTQTAGLSLKLSTPENSASPAFGPGKQPNEDATVLTMEEIDVWGRIRSGFSIPDLENEQVASQLKWYSSRPDYIMRTTNRASRYLFHVVQELEKRGMPTELALLPFIESAFNPQAFSTANAAGMWQFIPSTAKDFNLKQTMFKDERRGVLASTDAALTYLQRLHTMFGDWQLALAAYNWGEGNVARAVKKNQSMGKPIDYNSLAPLMPQETRNYYPKLQAVKQIIANPGLYNLTLPKVDNQPYFITIGKTSDIDVKVAAQLAEMSLEDFKALNPQFNRPVITGSAKTQILLPQENAARFKANLSNWGSALSSWTTHKITSARERIETLASKLGTTAAIIREVNNIPARMRLKAGSTILVPKTASSADKDIAPEVADSAVIATEPDLPDSRRISIRAGKRDTLAALAQRYKISVAQIKSLNGLKHDKLTSGQSLKLDVPYSNKHDSAKSPIRASYGKSSGAIKAASVRFTPASRASTHAPQRKSAPATRSRASQKRRA